MALSFDRYQKTAIRALADRDACIDLGAGGDLNVSEFPGILTRLESNRVHRRSFSLKGRAIVDGGGLERVAHILKGAIGARPDISLLEGVG